MAAKMISGMAFAMMTGAAFLVGIYFHRIKGMLKLFSVVVTIAAMAAGSGILYLADGIIPVFFGVAFIGLGEGFLLPLIFHSVRTTVDLSQSVSAMAIVSSMMYLGQFFSPIIIDSIGKQWMPLSQGARSQFIVACCMSIGGAILIGLQILIINNKYHIKIKKI